MRQAKPVSLRLESSSAASMHRVSRNKQLRWSKVYDHTTSRKEREPCRPPVQMCSHTVDVVITSLNQLQNGAEGIGAFLETAPPPCYLVYLLAAGFGLPCSEDALVAWVGANIAKSVYGSWHSNVIVLAIIYAGVVASDMVTFGIGALLKLGLFKAAKKLLLSNPDTVERASAMVRKWSRYIGCIQRFSLGFRGPLCLVCGFTNVPAGQFLAGVSVGALGTMPLQLFAGYLLRGSSNPYLAALALASGPNLVGHILGPAMTALGLWSVNHCSQGQRKDGLSPS